MKASLTHLPAIKQAEVLRIAKIIREVINPEMIILFGSYAKGTYVEHRYTAGNDMPYEYISDYDFLVVTQNNPQKTDIQENLIMSQVGRHHPPVNLEIHDIDYINKGLERGEYFFADIVTEGIRLYDAGNMPFTISREFTAVERKEKAQRYFDTWFPQGVAFIDTCRFSAGNNNLRIAVFLLHQAVESLYYTTLLVFTDYKPKTHNLWKLRKKAKPYSEELFSVFRAETDKKEESLFDLLKRGYIDARYRADYSISNEQLTILIGRVLFMMSVTERICKSRITAFR